jgi:deoxyribodipyrimidine photo-lyase
MTTVVWFRRDLRTGDNPALTWAAARGKIVPVYVLDDVTPGPWRIGAAQRWWLHHSLATLKSRLGGLVIVAGDPRELVPDIATRLHADAVVWNRTYEPWAAERDGAVSTALRQRGVEMATLDGGMRAEPWEVSNGGGPYKVFSAYWRAAQKRPLQPPLPTPTELDVAHPPGIGVSLAALGLLPVRPNWALGWEDLWQPGEAGAEARLRHFLAHGLDGYASLRDRPDLDHTTRLSPHLHMGEISSRQVLAALRDTRNGSEADHTKLASEIGWREFAWHIQHFFPEFHERHWRSGFDAYPYRNDPDVLAAWQRGQTGYPLVDAGMRQLWQTGWMHNRVRMVVASFLTKHLMIDWRKGEAWFWDTLVDADLANNAMGWQWVAGSGVDAAPYFRVFNPAAQGARFDPDGAYVRRWCPELAGLPTAHLHAPWEAPPLVLTAAGVRLGETYPTPIVEHGAARAEALAGYQRMRSASADA